MANAPEIIKQLVQRFSDNVEAYRSGPYNETQVRREFIDPMFKALGWDVDNERGWAEAYKEVIHEDAIKVGGATKAPDYCFRIGGTRKFFLEAKKPSVSIRSDPMAAYQLRRYAWSAKLPLSILTDFEEFAIYDCRAKPNQNDKASVGRTLYLKYTDYLDRWDEIANIFSKEVILKGSFDKYAESTGRKRGTAEVDASFLAEIESWRDGLARNIALRNKDLGVREMNHAVQRTIDRLVFLRICEDRGIELYGRLQALLNTGDIYPRLGQLFVQADERYNSGLFHFRSERDREAHDGWTLELEIDDKVLKEIIRRLYYPECPFEFSVLPADILGQIYEQFLGKVIRLTPSHQAKVEYKPEVRKAGGVYYTPTYIVDYIVKNTVGKLCEGSTPKKVAELRILDPACGSGSFLLGAYQCLLDWHLKWYIDHDPAKHTRGKKPAVYEGRAGWTLTTAKRKEILLNNIYGVDIDQQAVEVTKLSLLLKVLEGETDETLANQKLLFKERALPDLASNIKCGNSLIGPDFYEGKQLAMFDQEEVYRINAFDWSKEFPETMTRGGFDAVIGNPPYLFITEVPQSHRGYYEHRYRSASYRFDLYGAFIEKMIVDCLNVRGILGFITPHTLLSNDSFKALRAVLTRFSTISRVVDLGPGVFLRARNETMLLFLQRGPTSEDSRVEVIRTTVRDFPTSCERYLALQTEWAAEDGRPWLVHASPENRRLLDHMTRTPDRLGDLCTINQGLRTGDNERYLSRTAEDNRWKRAAGGKHVHRYGRIQSEVFVLYEEKLLDAPRRPGIFLSVEKIVVQEVRNITLRRRIAATLDVHQFFCLQSTNVINRRKECALDLRYLLGILNSKAANHFFRSSFPGNNHIPANQLAKVPIPQPLDVARHDRMVELVERMLELHKRLGEVRTEHDKEVLKRQIQATDDEIDRLVYELYDLTEEEIEIVEGKG